MHFVIVIVRFPTLTGIKFDTAVSKRLPLLPPPCIALLALSHNKLRISGTLFHLTGSTLFPSPGSGVMLIDPELDTPLPHHRLNPWFTVGAVG
jgi:hypothetical protein